MLNAGSVSAAKSDDVDAGDADRANGGGGVSFNPKDYHPDWKSIARQIKDQADHKCEFCGVPDGETGARDSFGMWHSAVAIADMSDEMAWLLWPMTGYPEPKRYLRIVLTTAHLCWETCADKMCIDPAHLRSLCQRCHLNYDRKHHLAVQAANRRARKLALQPELVTA